MARIPFRLTTAIAALIATAGTAFAQADACRAYRSQLAALDQAGGGRNYAALAEQQRRELGRMQAYYRSLSCDRGQFLFFGAPPPPECGPAAQRLRAMEANYARLAQQAAGGGGQQRQALLAAIERACNPQTAAVPQPRGLFDSLFGVPERRPVPEEYDLRRPPEGAPLPGEEPGPVRVGGGKPVCVRSCDGYFWPVGSLPGGRAAAGDEYCQALCPGTETSLFYLPGDSDLQRAVSSQGKPYTSLPGAFRFRKAADPSCSCRAPGQSWVEALRRAEEMIDRRRGDIVVTAQKAEELSRPREAPRADAPRGEASREAPRTGSRGDARGQASRQARPEEAPIAAPVVDEAETRAAAEAGAAAPTAGTESAGIGPRSIETGTVVGRESGQRRDVVTDTGNRRSVRVVAPDVVAVPNNRM